MATDSLYHDWNADSPFIWCSEEVGDEKCIGDILGHLQMTAFP